MKAGWQVKKLGEVCEVYQPQTISQKQMVAGEFPVYGANGKIGTHNQFNHGVQQLILGCRGSCGTVHFTEPRAWINGNAMVVQAKDGVMALDFLAYALRGGIDIADAITGTAQPQITRTSLMPIPISYPESLPEQKRIVGLLDEAFAALASAQSNDQKNLQNARALFESHLQSVFTQRGKGWVETTLGEIGKVSMCKRIFKEETTSTGDIPFYKIGTFGKEPDAFIPIRTYTEYKAKYSFPKKGDILISASGTIGRRVRYDGKPAYFQDSNIVWIDNDQKQLLNDYLYHFYGACKWNSTKGATILRLYNDNLRQILIAFPESLATQQSIVSQLDALSAETRRLETLYTQKLAVLAELKKSLLHQAFTGEL